MTPEPAPTRYDVAVVGGGPAGLTAALVLSRARRRVLLVDAGQPRNRYSPSLPGFLTRDGASPQEFLTVARAEVDSYGTERVADTVTTISRQGDGFAVTLAGGRTALARRVVMASGLTDRLPEVAGLTERWGRDVLHCPYCHGHEVRDQPLAIIAGDSDGAVHQALLLRQWSSDLTLLLHDVDEGDLDPDECELLAARGVRLLPGRVDAVLTREDRLTGVRLSDGAELECSAVFAPLRFAVNDSALGGLDVERAHSDMGTRVATDSEGRTSVPGLWAVGNLADLSAQILDAAASGERAAIGINGELSLEDARRALHESGGRTGRRTVA